MTAKAAVFKPCRCKSGYTDAPIPKLKCPEVPWASFCDCLPLVAFALWSLLISIQVVDVLEVWVGSFVDCVVYNLIVGASMLMNE